MGTNYYAVKNGPSTKEPIHIGKSSYGWLFSFQAQNEPWNDPPVVWNSITQVRDWLKKYTVDSNEYVIMDEYDDVISFDDFFAKVEAKQNDPHCKNNPDNFSYSRNVDGYRFTEGWFQ